MKILVGGADDIGRAGGKLAELRVAARDLSECLAKVEKQLATSTTRRSGRSSR
ncbi:hypothetical protein ACFOY2_45015 [Nonomuraea purpurea]|uniref:Uncharacterized protein n=1 Tax=Nonomuraea purpurea TaxID=1849276 RepID=A0ABV8GKG9_9ACTN